MSVTRQGSTGLAPQTKGAAAWLVYSSLRTPPHLPPYLCCVHVLPGFEDTTAAPQLVGEERACRCVRVALCE